MSLIHALHESQPFEEGRERTVSPQELQEFYRQQEVQDLQRRSTRRSVWSRRSFGSKSARSNSTSPTSPTRERFQSPFSTQKAMPMTPEEDSAPFLQRKQGEWNRTAPFHYKAYYEIHNPVGPRRYMNYHLLRKAPTRGGLPPPTAYGTQSSPHEHTPSPQDTPAITPQSSAISLPQRRRKISLTSPQDDIDLLDGTDPWGQNYHHVSPYDVGIEPKEMNGNRLRILGPSPLSQSSSAVHLPSGSSASVPTRKLSKRRTTPARALFTSSGKQEAKSEQSSFQVLRRQSVDAVVLSAGEPERPQRIRRTSLLGKLAKRFSLLKKPAGPEYGQPPEVAPPAESNFDQPAAAFLQSPTSISHPGELGRASSTPLLPTIIGSPNSTVNGKDPPRLHQDERASIRTPLKRIPPPSIDAYIEDTISQRTSIVRTDRADAGSTAPPTSIRQSVAFPSVESKPADEAPDDSSSSISIPFESGLGRLTIANPDPATPTQVPRALPSTRPRSSPAQPQSPPQLGARGEKEYIIPVPMQNGLIVRSPPEGMASLPPVERPYLSPLNPVTPFRISNVLFNDSTPRASMHQGAAQVQLIENPLPPTPAASSITFPTATDSQPSPAMMSQNEISSNGQATPKRRQSPVRAAAGVGRQVTPKKDERDRSSPRDRETRPYYEEPKSLENSDLASEKRGESSRIRSNDHYNRRRSPPRQSEDGGQREGRQSPSRHPVYDNRRSSPVKEAKRKQTPPEGTSEQRHSSSRHSHDDGRRSDEYRPSHRDMRDDPRYSSTGRSSSHKHGDGHEEGTYRSDGRHSRTQRTQTGNESEVRNSATTDRTERIRTSGERVQGREKERQGERDRERRRERDGTRTGEVYRLMRTGSEGGSKDDVARVVSGGQEWEVVEGSNHRSHHQRSPSLAKEGSRPRDIGAQSRDDLREREYPRPEPARVVDESGRTSKNKQAPNVGGTGQDRDRAALLREGSMTAPPILPPKNVNRQIPPGVAPSNPQARPQLSSHSQSTPAPPIQEAPQAYTIPSPLPRIEGSSARQPLDGRFATRDDGRSPPANAPPTAPSPQNNGNRQTESTSASSSTSKPHNKLMKLPSKRVPPPPDPAPQPPLEKPKSNPQLNLNKAQPPRPPPTPAPASAPAPAPATAPSGPRPLVSQSQALPPAPAPQSRGMSRPQPQSARPTSDFPREIDYANMRAREAWEAERLKKGKSSVFGAEYDMYNQGRPSGSRPPPQSTEWMRVWSQPTHTPVGGPPVSMTISRAADQGSTFSDPNAYGSTRTSYTVQAPFLAQAHGRQVYAPYNPHAAPLPAFSDELDQSRKANPLPEPPKLSQYSSRRAQDSQTTTEYWKNYSGLAAPS